MRASISNDLKEMSTLDNYLFLTRKDDLSPAHSILYSQSVVPYYVYTFLSGTESYSLTLNTMQYFFRIGFALF